MKKFERLAPEMRREEIQTAALSLFLEKGFAATTMENIVSRVSLSKGGVYRIYPSTAAILSDLMLKAMRMRNEFYAEKVRSLSGPLDLDAVIGIVVDSLLLFPEYSRVYVEFLWEKQRNPALEELYQQLCATTVEETEALVKDSGGPLGPGELMKLTDIMNSAILTIHVLGKQDYFTGNRDRLCLAIGALLKI